MVGVRVILDKFLLFNFSFVHFGCIFNKTIIPLVLVEYEMHSHGITVIILKVWYY